jgi:outer membrane protein TolC
MAGWSMLYNNQADLQIKSNEYNYELTKHNLEKDVIDQYINCWQAQELYILSNSTSDTLKQQLGITRKPYDERFSQTVRLSPLKD